jgi:hypothetical protein
MTLLPGKMLRSRPVWERMGGAPRREPLRTWWSHTLGRQRRWGDVDSEQRNDAGRLAAAAEEVEVGRRIKRSCSGVSVAIVAPKRPRT